MNQEWSSLNKQMQLELKKEVSFRDGINTLLLLRESLMKQMTTLKEVLSKEQFCAIPFINADGYHSKTIAYSIYHIFRIEDIVAHTLIQKEKEIFFLDGFQRKMNSPIITTGNELVKQEIADFSSQLDLNSLYEYITKVAASTNQLLNHLSFSDLKTTMTEQDKKKLHELGVVCEEEQAVWLIDYWCNKNVKGLIQMPFSRHWIMHIEACLRIEKKILNHHI